MLVLGERRVEMAENMAKKIKHLHMKLKKILEPLGVSELKSSY